MKESKTTKTHCKKRYTLKEIFEILGVPKEAVLNIREEAVQKYSEWILTQPDLMDSLHELKDKVLGCWCKPKQCHGDVLIRLVERGE